MLITFRTMGDFKAQLVSAFNRLFKGNVSPEYLRKYLSMFFFSYSLSERNVKQLHAVFKSVMREIKQKQQWVHEAIKLENTYAQLIADREAAIRDEISIPEPLRLRNAQLEHHYQAQAMQAIHTLTLHGVDTSNQTVMDSLFWERCIEFVKKVGVETYDRHLIADVVSDPSSTPSVVYVLQMACRHLYCRILQCHRSDWRDVEDATNIFFRCHTRLNPIKECDNYIEEHVRGLFFLRELEELFKGERQPRDAALFYRQPLELCRAGKIHIEHLILYVYFKWHSVQPEDHNNYIKRYSKMPQLYKFLTESELCGIFLGEDCPTIRRYLGFQHLNSIARGASEELMFKRHPMGVSHTAHNILSREFPGFNGVPMSFIQGFEEMVRDLDGSVAHHPEWGTEMKLLSITGNTD